MFKSLSGSGMQWDVQIQMTWAHSWTGQSHVSYRTIIMFNIIITALHRCCVVFSSQGMFNLLWCMLVYPYIVHNNSISEIKLNRDCVIHHCRKTHQNNDVAWRIYVNASCSLMWQTSLNSQFRTVFVLLVNLSWMSFSIYRLMHHSILLSIYVYSVVVYW